MLIHTKHLECFWILVRSGNNNLQKQLNLRINSGKFKVKSHYTAIENKKVKW
jgi:hypothetical protein